MMKKISTMILAFLCATFTFSQSYGILVNGKTYFAGSYTDEFEGFTQYLAHVQVQSGDYCQLYDAENKAAWAVDVNQYSESGFVRDGNKINISVSGCYDFYIKLKYEADELYVGPGSDCGSGQDISGSDTPVTPGYSGSAPAKCTDVVFQAFYWDSYKDQGYGRTKWIDYLNGSNGTSAEEIGQWFDLIWLPPMSKSTGGTGYLPVDYSSLDGAWGTKANLVKLITTLHQNGARVVADIVINHVAGSNGWCSFAKLNFGEYGTFQPDASWICSTDEMNSSSEAGSCKGQATGNPDDGYGSEANYDSGRDWDHNNSQVRDMCKAYLKWLRNDIKIDGFRYDYCKGFHNSHINDYNKAAEAYFSVMEMWDGNVNTLMSHLNDAGYNTLTFDFATKYQAFNNGIASDYYEGLKGAGLPGAGKARYAVTFLDSHDSFQRDDNEFCGLGNSMKYEGKIQQCYAYLLSMPGVPLVFFPHWVKFKDKIKPMLNARYKTGVHSESAVSDEAGSGYYNATITGTNGEIRLLVGPNSGYNTTPAGYTKAVTGENYGVYYKTTSARGDKNTERKDLTPVEEVNTDVRPLHGDKFIENGQLFIRCGEQVYDMMGNKVK
ncbi:MAG: hypothetical protein IJT12_01830 [Paludibacteraceae bacterium]|nr:hypothetical protein [Paludibacteraceae bacterium]